MTIARSAAPIDRDGRTGAATARTIGGATIRRRQAAAGGRRGEPADDPLPGFFAYLGEVRELVLREIDRMLPRSARYRPILYDLMLQYPLRAAKTLRPAMCIAIARSLGGRLEAALPSAAALEVYHNAFLIHDDVEDGSDFRRQSPTLHRAYGVPIAVNVGDAMLALTLEPLLANMRTLGLGKALRVLELVSRMARESAEGQAIELDWIRHGEWSLRDADYVRMVYKKTSWYSFVTPLATGAIIAGAAPPLLAALRRFGALLGIAFQLQDDILNLTAERERYGKEIGGDLWEGKHTLILLHMMRSVGEVERTRARAILAKPRPDPNGGAAASGGGPGASTVAADGDEAASALVDDLERRRRVSARQATRLRNALRPAAAAPADGAKTEADVAYLLSLIDRAGSTQYAQANARQWARRAERVFGTLRASLEPSVHRDFLQQLVQFVVGRDH